MHYTECKTTILHRTSLTCEFVILPISPLQEKSKYSWLVPLNLELMKVENPFNLQTHQQRLNFLPLFLPSYNKSPKNARRKKVWGISITEPDELCASMWKPYEWKKKYLPTLFLVHTHKQKVSTPLQVVHSCFAPIFQLVLFLSIRPSKQPTSSNNPTKLILFSAFFLTKNFFLEKRSELQRMLGRRIILPARLFRVKNVAKKGYNTDGNCHDLSFPTSFFFATA